MSIKAVELEIEIMIDRLRHNNRLSDAALLASDLFSCSNYADFLMVRDDAERLTSDLPS